MKVAMSRVGLAAVALCCSYAAQAAVIYSNGGQNPNAGTNMSDSLVADNFTIGAASNTLLAADR